MPCTYFNLCIPSLIHGLIEYEYQNDVILSSMLCAGGGMSPPPPPLVVIIRTPLQKSWVRACGRVGGGVILLVCMFAEHLTWGV